MQLRITTFTNVVDLRRETLDLACGFYGHTKEVFTWMHQVTESDNPGEHFPPNIEGMEDELTNFHRDRSALEAALERVVTEGKLLVRRLQDSDEVTHLRTILVQVRQCFSCMSCIVEIYLEVCLISSFSTPQSHDHSSYVGIFFPGVECDPNFLHGLYVQSTSVMCANIPPD